MWSLYCGINLLNSINSSPSQVNCWESSVYFRLLLNTFGEPLFGSMQSLNIVLKYCLSKLIMNIFQNKTIWSNWIDLKWCLQANENQHAIPSSWPGIGYDELISINVSCSVNIEWSVWAPLIKLRLNVRWDLLLIFIFCVYAAIYTVRLVIL